MPKRRRAADSAATVDIVSQLEIALHRPQATLIGALVGGIVPWFARTLAHEEVPSVWGAGNTGLALAMIVVVLGCALFSALTVYKFGRAVFSDKRKALGFTVALEGVMLVSHGMTSLCALIVLIAINALSNGSSIAMAREATCKRREASRRAAATRSQGRTKLADRTPQARRGKPALVPVPRWTPDVVDAEIVSEESFS